MIELKVAGSYQIELIEHSDYRGHFQELFNCYNKEYLFQDWKQVSKSLSNKNVVRGIHVSPFPKLCTCLSGSLWDIVVDLRKDSPTYLKWDAVWLSPGKNQVYVPANCGHGFFSGDDNTTLLYLQGGVYDPLLEVNINWQDPILNIYWPNASYYTLSDKDLKAPLLQI